MDDPRLDDKPEHRSGFHAAEGEGETSQRWTAGNANLAPALWHGCRGDTFLILELAAPPLQCWRAPRKAVAPHLTLVPDA